MDEPKSFDTSVHEFALALGQLIRRLRSANPSETNDLSWTQKSVLQRLEKEGPTSTAELARGEGVKPQSMGTAVARLEELGMIERQPHATDKRQMIILLSEKGRDMRQLARDARHKWLAQMMKQLSKQEKATLFAASEIIQHLAEL